MTPWILVLGVVGAGLLWLFIKWLWLGSTDGPDAHSLRESLIKQAQKREGRVHLRNGQYTLTIPYQTANIDLSAVSHSEEIYRDCTYATVRLEHFAGKNFKVLRDSDKLLLKPLVVGTRLKLEDEGFNEEYIMTGSDPALVEGLLTQEVRDKLRSNSLQVIFGRRIDAAILDREQGWLSIFTQGFRVEDRLFDVLVETTMLLYDRLTALNNETDAT